MKISTIPPKTPALDAVDKARDSVESASHPAQIAPAQAAATAAADPVAQIAHDVASGKIGQKEAVDRILEDVLNAPMLDAVPASVRGELENALRMLIAEDPHLMSLCAAVAPNEIK